MHPFLILVPIFLLTPVHAQTPRAMVVIEGRDRIEELDGRIGSMELEIRRRIAIRRHAQEEIDRQFAEMCRLHNEKYLRCLCG